MTQPVILIGAIADRLDAADCGGPGEKHLARLSSLLRRVADNKPF
jgi:hypothetical protein